MEWIFLQNEVNTVFFQSASVSIVEIEISGPARSSNLISILNGQHVEVSEVSSIVMMRCYKENLKPINSDAILYSNKIENCSL